MELAIVGLVVAGALALMYFTRKKKEDEVKPPVDEPDFFEGWDEFKTPEELITQGAVDTTKEALIEAQQAEISAELDQNAVAVRDYENVLAETQEQSILEPTTPSYSEIAAQKEAEAQEARARLEAQWNKALAFAQDAMTRAKLAADDAWAAYSTAFGKYRAATRNIDIWVADVALFSQRLEAAKQELSEFDLHYSLGGGWTWRPIWKEDDRRDLVDKVNSAQAELNNSETNLEKWRNLAAEAHNVASRCKSDAVHAISNANDTVERVLTITADIRLLGILLSLCDRVDVIARATRTKLGQLESQMSAMAL